MIPFLTHVRKCDCCRRYPNEPCAIGLRLFEQGADRIARYYIPMAKA